MQYPTKNELLKIHNMSRNKTDQPKHYDMNNTDDQTAMARPLGQSISKNVERNCGM